MDWARPEWSYITQICLLISNVLLLLARTHGETYPSFEPFFLGLVFPCSGKNLPLWSKWIKAKWSNIMQSMLWKIKEVCVGQIEYDAMLCSSSLSFLILFADSARVPRFKFAEMQNHTVRVGSEASFACIVEQLGSNKVKICLSLCRPRSFIDFL